MVSGTTVEKSPYVSIGKMPKLLEIAERSGIENPIPKQVRNGDLVDIITLMDAITKCYKRLDEENLKIKRQSQHLSSSFLLHNHSLEEYMGKVDEAAELLSFLLNNIQKFQTQLQNPFQGKGIDVDPEFHKDVIEAFKQVNRILTQSGGLSLNPEKLSSFTLSESNLRESISSISSFLAILRKKNESINMLTNTLQKM